MRNSELSHNHWHQISPHILPRYWSCNCISFLWFHTCCDSILKPLKRPAKLLTVLFVMLI